MLIWITITGIFILAFISGWNNPQQKQKDNYEKETDLQPIYDDGEIVGWYEEQ